VLAAIRDWVGRLEALDLVSVGDDLRERSRSTVTIVNGLISPIGERPSQIALEPSLSDASPTWLGPSRSTTPWQIALTSSTSEPLRSSTRWT
jgi:hypothetical protein